MPTLEVSFTGDSGKGHRMLSTSFDHLILRFPQNERRCDGGNHYEAPNRVHQSETKQNLVYSLLINTAEVWRYSSKTIDRLFEDYGVYEILDFVITQLSRHPFLAFGMSICVLACALPFVVFMVFAIATVIMTFTGFVIIEGE